MDENFPKASISFLESAGHEVFDVRLHGERGASDADVIRLALKKKALLLSTDRDFFHTLGRQFPDHFGLVVIALKRPTSGAITERLKWFLSYFEAADLFHVSGITPALSSETREMTLSAIKLAKKMSLKVSYDSNYRAKLWSQVEAGEFLAEVLKYVDYAFLGILDMQFLLGMDAQDLEKGYAELKSTYPNLDYIASTDRTVIDPFHHLLAVNVYDGELYTTEQVSLSVIDRIGAGDVFTAGILDGILLGKKKEEIASFALADAIIKHARFGDNCFIKRAEVEAVQSGGSLAISR
ncbi:MAG: PfkB family carbohydrate kinase [Chthoniobacterales bacterium]